MPRPIVELIPWDPDSPEHVQRLVEQRIQCGWNFWKVETWREEQRKGTGCMYWITLPRTDPSFGEMQRLHLTMYPKEIEPLQDSSTSLRGETRVPSRESYHVIGHISLNSEDPNSKDVDLDLPEEGVYWIKSFYVTTALQSKGVGGAAMDAVESMAFKPPLYARTLALDTMHEKDQMREDFSLAAFGRLPPKVSNMRWYLRRGYKLIKTMEDYYKSSEGDAYPDLRAVFMRKDVTDGHI